MARERSSKQKILKEGSDAVTGLAFQTSSKDNYLFVATTASVYLYNVSHKDHEKKVNFHSLFCDKLLQVLIVFGRIIVLKCSARFVEGEAPELCVFPGGLGNFFKI